MKRSGMLAGILWIAFGARELLVGSLAPTLQPVPPAMPLESLPLQILGEGWRGENVPLDPDVKQRAKVAAYVQRTYQGDRASLWFYVGYVDRWVPEAIHHPDVCFPGSGFEQIAKNAITVPDATIGTPLNFREYLWNNPRGGGTYTLSTFYYNGKFEPDEWKLRWDGIFGVPYFVVITISGTLTGNLEETREFYSEVVRRSMPRLLEHFAR
ncbi:MAG TPA: exosortase-associated EpsI family protein [Planctomycetota bacterium]|nr:exosortase-associated EpsI family protein [Planctomycetota bacterium]